MLHYSGNKSDDSWAILSFCPERNKVHMGKNHDQYTHTLYSSVLLPQAVAL